MKLDDPDGDGVGEVLARGPNVFAGYHDLHDKTAEAFTPNGWFRTGDLGRFDTDGYLEIVGRSSEVLVLAGGKHVVPEDVRDWLVERYRDRRVTPDTSPQLDLGIDSLEWMDLTLDMRDRRPQKRGALGWTGSFGRAHRAQPRLPTWAPSTTRRPR